MIKDAEEEAAAKDQEMQMQQMAMQLSMQQDQSQGQSADGQPEPPPEEGFRKITARTAARLRTATPSELDEIRRKVLADPNMRRLVMRTEDAIKKILRGKRRELY